VAEHDRLKVECDRNDAMQLAPSADRMRFLAVAVGESALVAGSSYIFGIAKSVIDCAGNVALTELVVPPATGPVTATSG